MGNDEICGPEAPRLGADRGRVSLLDLELPAQERPVEPTLSPKFHATEMAVACPDLAIQLEKAR
jgi:hypothetical protein